MFTEVADEQAVASARLRGIEKLIVLGEFKPGDRLPSEYELAQRLGVGRSTVREATKALVSRNILESIEGTARLCASRPALCRILWGCVFSRTKSGWASICARCAL
ncbi:MAG: winged helix-turn-helix domain-containing protein [Ruthenibacterium lactatiformans]